MLRGENLMATKRKFKRDYIMLEAKDLNYRYKEKVSPKAFAKIEVTNDKSVIALYAENLKDVSEGYSVVAIRSDYETIDLGTFNVNSQGKGEFSIDIGEDDIDIKGVAVVQDKSVPLIGFKGNKIDNYEDILFPPQYEFEDIDDEDYVDTSDDDYYDGSDDEYEEIEYIEVEEDNIDDERNDTDDTEVYEEIEYVDPDEINEYEYEEIIYEEVEPDDERDGGYGYIYDDNEEEYEYIEIEEDERIEEPKKLEEKKVSRKKNEDEYIEKKIKKAKSILGKQYTNISNKNNNNNVKNKQETIKTAGTLLMPRQIKKGLKYFKEVKPFVSDYIDNTRWWKIEINPTTMCGYTMPYLGYVNTLNYTMYSDAVMQSYKYRHYLFGVQYDDYNKRQYYIYAVPGRKIEQPDKGHTGFTRYQPCDTRNNSLGYWLCFVDCKARKIVK